MIPNVLDLSGFTLYKRLSVRRFCAAGILLYCHQTISALDPPEFLNLFSLFSSGVRDKVPELINVPPKTPTLVREVHLFPAASIFGTQLTLEHFFGDGQSMP